MGLRHAAGTIIAVCVLVVLLIAAAGPASAQGWQPLSGNEGLAPASPALPAAPANPAAPPAQMAPGGGPGGPTEAEGPASGDVAARYAFFRQWIELNGQKRAEIFAEMKRVLKEGGVDIYRHSGILMHQPRMIYNELQGHLDTGTCKLSSIKGPTFTLVFASNGYYPFADDDKIFVFGLIAGKVQYGLPWEPHCDPADCPPIKIDGNAFASMRTGKTFRSCTTYPFTTLSLIGMEAQKLFPIDAYRNTTESYVVAASEFVGKGETFRRFRELWDTLKSN